MPAPVAPGYTRGPLLFWGVSSDPTVEQGLRQWIWREAGGYGARLVLITVEAAYRETLAVLRTELANWECDRLDEIIALDRTAARNPEYVAHVEQATGMVLIGDDPLRLAATLGGTLLAQAIRRANARSKLVAGMGAAGAFLCQHMISPGSQPTSLRGTITFGPGLGLVNRLVVDANATSTAHSAGSRTRLLAAVASNPFLIGVGVAPGSAAILYPDNTLQANGPVALMIVDGQEIGDAHLDADLESSKANGIEGARHYELQAGDGFNLDDHSLRPHGQIDLPPTGPVTSVF
jgi:cyanophycinase